MCHLVLSIIDTTGETGLRVLTAIYSENWTDKSDKALQDRDEPKAHQPGSGFLLRDR